MEQLSASSNSAAGPASSASVAVLSLATSACSRSGQKVVTAWVAWSGVITGPDAFPVNSAGAGAAWFAGGAARPVEAAPVGVAGSLGSVGDGDGERDGAGVSVLIGVSRAARAADPPGR